MAELGIRESPYETGLYFIPPEPGTTQQSIGTQQWKVGERYKLQRVLGYGSFSAVCLALDMVTGEQVALKRMGDVLHSPEQAKRVLREICILRRLSHPNVIGLRDCFIAPAATGQCRLVGGKLVHVSIDVYIAMEYADGGDLFHLRGQLSEEEVKSLMWQMLQTLRWLHSLHVWHRDIKSQNVFLVWQNGQRVAKLGDFGSARSAIPEGYKDAEQAPPGRSGSAAGSRNNLLRPSDSYQRMEAQVQPGDIYVQFENGVSGRGGFKAPLTRVVATPCYRAPEVVMSRGGYTSSIDVWSLGCIFGELLARIAHVGSAATPNLQVAPLFAIHGLPKTPDDGESFAAGPGDETTQRELQALFDVIGTPAWADVAAVAERSWRQYLHHLPGKAPMLYRRFWAKGEAAVDLLSRLLAFDPTRRASADEALAHEYFSDLLPEDSATLDEASAAQAIGGLAGPGVAAVGQQEQEQQEQQQQAGSGLPRPCSANSARLLPPLPPRQASAGKLNGAAAMQQAPSAANANTLAGPFAAAMPLSTSAASSEHGLPLGRSSSGDVAMVDVVSSRESSPPLGRVAAGSVELPPLPAFAPSAEIPPPPGAPRYWNEPNPGRALALLEVELGSLRITETPDPTDPSSQRLRQLLEMEVDAIASVLGGGASPAAGPKRRARVPQASEHGHVLRGLLGAQRGPGLQEDVASLQGMRSVDYGRERLSNVADTWQGRELDPARILGPQRHGEWAGAGQPAKPSAGPAWGVAALPPGMDRNDERMKQVLQRQQGR